MTDLFVIKNRMVIRYKEHGMRVRMTAKQPNADRFINGIMDRYHFGVNSRNELLEIYNKIVECMEPYAIYRINSRVTGIKLIDDSQAAIVAMTLGKGLDELKDDYTKNSELDKAYMLDCISNEILMNMYVEFNNLYSRFHRRYVKRYVFIGDEIKTDRIPGLLDEINERDNNSEKNNKKTENSDNDMIKDKAGKEEMLFSEEIGTIDMPKEDKAIKDNNISANEYGVLTPTKSVVFYALLTENPNQICEGICDNCNNKSCENNPLYVEEEEENNKKNKD